MPADGSVGAREKSGVRKSVRMRYNKEAYCYIDPDYLATLGQPPKELQRQLEEVFVNWWKDANGQERLKLRMHPHIRRWCLWEKAFIPSLGKNLWKCFWICQDEPKKGQLPADLQGDKLKAHFTGVIGEFRLPNRKDFIEVEQYNRKKYGVTAVTDQAGKWQGEEEAALEAKANEQIHAFLDENWFLAMDEANQAAGSGQYMRSSHCANWTHKGSVERYRRIQKNGYVVIEKKTRAEFRRELAKETVKLLKPQDKMIVEELLNERLSQMSESDADQAQVQPLTVAQGAQLAKLARQNRDRVLASLRLKKGTKTL